MSGLDMLLSTCSSPAQIVAAISKIVRQDEMLYHFGSFTPSIYDTAWLSMACKKDNGQISWLFPESFEYILQSQQEDGTWQSYASSVDGILNTLASLLALLVHRSTGQFDSQISIELSRCIEKARNGVRSLLQSWSVEDTVHVGFEVLVPSLLRQVGQHGFQFDFSGRQCLFDLYSKKTKSFKPEMAYSRHPTTLLHSLEAFIGLIDFDQVSHHCSEELGIFGSPAATAAYLLNCSTWDSRAETYLRTTVAESGNCGGVPSAFPTGLFEISWALSTLFSGSVNLENLNSDDVESLSLFYKRILKDQAGVIGFARGILEDADDTARALLTLHYLDYEIDPTPMIEKFKSSSCFRTYQSERNPSFSVNCNVLLALLCSGSIEKHSMLVQHTVEFLIAEWATEKISDKWNLSPYYSSMLLAEALISTLKKLNDGLLLQLPTNLMEHKIPITLCQILSKTLTSQHNDGSWRQSVEETAYNLIIIARCLSLPWDADLRLHIIRAFNRAQLFVSATQVDDQQVDYLWVEKVTYGSSLLRRVYRSTALNIPIKKLEWNSKVEKSFLVFESYQKHTRLLFSNLPLFAGSSSDYMGLAFLEATCFAECLKEVRCNRII